MNIVHLSDLLKDKIGYSVSTGHLLRDFDGFTCGADAQQLGSRTKSDVLHSLRNLDFILVDHVDFQLSDVQNIKEICYSTLKPHGLVFLRASLAGATIPPDFEMNSIHQILSWCDFEFLRTIIVDDSKLHLFRYTPMSNGPEGGAAVVAATGPLPLRYRIADRINEIISSVPGLKEILKRILGRI